MTTIRHPPHKSTVSNGQPGFSDFFGEPRGGPIVTNPYTTYARETLALPEVYKGTNPYLTNVMITIIQDEQLVPTRFLMPIRQTQDETSITWDEFNFNSAILGAVPEEGISRLVTQNISERQDYYVRKGLAFMIEHGFMNSPKGRMTYKMNLEQIRDAILQSLYIDVIEALLRCKTNSHIFMQCYGKSITAATARKRLDMEVESWAEIQKTDYGWDMLNSRAQKLLKLNGVTPDAWVIDDGIKKYIAGVRRENWAYFIKGPNGPKLYDEQLSDGDPTSLDVSAGTLIFECKQFNLPGHDDAVNIMSRRRTIGEYNVSFPHVDYSACKDYSSAYRDIMIYDEDRDGFKKISITEGLDNCMRFDEQGDLFFPDNFDGDDMFKKPRADKTSMREDVDYLGEMQPKHFTDEAIRDWTTSVVVGLENETETARDIAVMKSLVAKLEKTPEDNIPTQWYFKHIAAAYATRSLDDKGVGRRFFDPNTGLVLPPIKGNTAETALTESEVETAHLTAKPAVLDNAGVPKDVKYYPDDILFDGKTEEALFVPYGYGTHIGIEELAQTRYKSTYPAIHAEAAQAMRGFNALVQRLEAVCYDNLFMRGRSAPFFYQKKDMAASIFTHLVHEQRPPMVVIDKSYNLAAGGNNKTVTLTDKKSLLDMFRELLNPRTYDTSLPTDAKTEKQVRSVLDPAMQRVTELFKVISADYRATLYLMMAKLLKQEKTPEESKDTPSDVLLRIYDIIMHDLPAMEFMTLTQLLHERTNMSEGNLDVKYGGTTDFIKKINEARRPEQSPGSQEKTIITQLTCSEALTAYLEKAYNATGSAKNLRSYSKLEPGPDPMTGFKQIGAGEMFGEMTGIEKRDGAVNKFGMKRSRAAVTEFAQDTNQPWRVELAGDFGGRVDHCKALYTTGLHRAVSLALMGTPVTKQAFARFIQGHVVFPFNVIYSRPYMTYDMSTGVCMKAGKETGETLIGHADFQLGDNVVQKLHYGNFTFYSKAVVFKQQNVYLAEDMFSTGYVGGAGSRFFNCKEHMEEYEDGMKGRHCSIFAMLAPYSSQEYNNPIDMTGRYSGDLAPLTDSPDLHYASAAFYKAVWHWNEEVTPMPGHAKFDSMDSSGNTVCFQGHQSMYNPSNKMMDLVIKNTGHWGDRVYPGCGKVRQGMSKVLDPVSYNNIYGGGGALQGMTALK